MPKPNIVSLPPKRPDVQSPSKHKPQRFLSLRDVLDRLTISRSLLYELIKDPVQPFPAPVHLGRRSVWVEGEVEEYMTEIVEKDRQR
ncbi:MAG: AlpA family phage regulatory protein [Hyphomonas sp.]|nr:AlpA family phage regulatory protein [Hyphomonas sp.]